MKVTRPLIYLSSLSIILFFWVGFHFVQVGRHCLSSPLVNSVIFLGPKDEIASQLPSCDLAEYLRFWRPLAVGPEQKKILSRVLFLSRAQQLNLKSISPKIEVRISTIDPQIFMRGPGRILIGSEIINSAGFLERALLQEWLRSQSPLIGSDVFQLEVMSLLLWGYLTDSLVTTDPHTQAYVDLSQNKNWSRWIVSQSDYCYSPWVAFVHWENCQVKLSKLLASQGVSGSRKTIEKTALAPYVASIIWNLYESGGLKTKINFWRSWKLSWSAQAVFSRSSLPELVEPKSIGDVLNWTSKVVKIYWTSLGHSSPVDPLIESLVDIMVEGKSIPHRTLDDLTKFSKLNLDKIILIKLGENLLFEGLREVPLDLRDLPIRYYLMSGCEKISYKSLTHIDPNQNKLMAIDFCADPDIEYNWKSLAEGGWDNFILQNIRMKFIFFYLPSLRKNKPWPNAFKLDYSGIGFLANQLGWEQRKWDERLEVFRPLGVWDSVLMYRL